MAFKSRDAVIRKEVRSVQFGYGAGGGSRSTTTTASRADDDGGREGTTLTKELRRALFSLSLSVDV
jgi:hypothetical protein